MSIVERVWVSASEAGRILECRHQLVEPAAKIHGIRRRVLPGGSHLQYHASDLRRVAEEIVIV
jgi:hypothetical protein